MICDSSGLLSSGLQGCQGFLSVVQAVPICGPAIVSPVKALLSVIQIISGVVEGVFYTLFGDEAAGTNLNEKSIKAFENSKEGVIHLAKSVANIFSLGIFGLFDIILKTLIFSAKVVTVAAPVATTVVTTGASILERFIRAGVNLDIKELGKERPEPHRFQ